MSERRTSASVTDLDCTCKYLQRAADDPSVPIIFDSRTGEYQFTYQEPDSSAPAMLIFYHCPFCGGAAPVSKRNLLFHVIPREEERRLFELLAPVRTVQVSLSLLGPPDADQSAGLVSRKDEADGSPPSTEFSRKLTYRSLSEVAEVFIVERADGSAYCTLQGKYRGDVGDARA